MEKMLGGRKPATIKTSKHKSIKRRNRRIKLRKEERKAINANPKIKEMFLKKRTKRKEEGRKEKRKKKK